MFTRIPTSRPPFVSDLSWRQILQACVLTLTIPHALWALANPVAGTAVLAAAGIARLGYRRLDALAGCLRVCGTVAVDLGTVARITVDHPPDREGCC